MKFGTTYWRKVAIVAAFVTSLLMMSTTVASAHHRNPGVFPPDSHPYGRTYGQWSARWWQYAFSVTSLDQCVADPSGRVWFLAGATNSTPVQRSCTVPEGKALLFPIFNAEWSVIEAKAQDQSTPGNTCIVPDINGHPITATTQKALRACAIAQANHGKAKDATLEAQVDGVQLQDLTAYEALSPEFTFTAIAGNPFGVPAGKSESVADGFWIMLKIPSWEM
jgi:hypothetical protein